MGKGPRVRSRFALPPLLEPPPAGRSTQQGGPPLGGLQEAAKRVQEATPPRSSSSGSLCRIAQQHLALDGYLVNNAQGPPVQPLAQNDDDADSMWDGHKSQESSDDLEDMQ